MALMKHWQKYFGISVRGRMFNGKQTDPLVVTISPESYRNKKDFVRAAMTRTIDRMLERGRISAETAMTLRRGRVGRIAELLVDQKVSPMKK